MLVADHVNQLLMLSISLFVASTVALLAYLMAFQARYLGGVRYSYAWDQPDTYIVFVLQGQTIIAE